MTIGVFTPAPAATWPIKQPDSFLDYSYNAVADLGTDTLSAVTLAVAPSGSGELVASQLSFSGTVITAWLAGGVPGRSYVVKITGTCTTGRVFEWLVGLNVDPVLASFPLAAPPSTGFGTVLHVP
jgi:hypothetical protein